MYWVYTCTLQQYRVQKTVLDVHIMYTCTFMSVQSTGNQFYVCSICTLVENQSKLYAGVHNMQTLLHTSTNQSQVCTLLYICTLYQYRVHETSLMVKFAENHFQVCTLCTLVQNQSRENESSACWCLQIVRRGLLWDPSFMLKSYVWGGWPMRFQCKPKAPWFWVFGFGASGFGLDNTIFFS